METIVELSNEALEAIGGYVRRNLGAWIREVAPRMVSDRELLERMVRVEEELKNQRQLMQQGFAAIERRFGDMNHRFEDVNQRFEDINTRFEDINQRFDDINTRFEDVNSRFDDVNKRFEDMNKRFDDMHRSSTRWFTVLTVMVALIGLSGIVLPLLP